MPVPQDFLDHLGSGATTVCRCWDVLRTDGAGFGFTDHDTDIAFGGQVYRADTGMTAGVLQQTTGLSVDNSEALGVLSAAAISEADIAAGRFDGATVRAWLVNWEAPEQRVLQFKGTVGEIVRRAGLFQAELRGIAEALNQPQGRVYQRTCSALLGDSRCGVDLDNPAYHVSASIETVEDGRIFRFDSLPAFPDSWFDRGILTILSGQAIGSRAVVKNDTTVAGSRRIELWEPIRLPLAPGDALRVDAGCDKRAETCRVKFSNFQNFRGFPHIPGEDWLMTYPVRGGSNDGGSLSSGSSPQITVQG